MTAVQFDEWQAYFAEEPFGEEYNRNVLEVQIAKLCTIIANCHAGKGKTYQVKDFLPKKKEEKQSVEEMKSILASVANSKRRK